ncbi:MAG TPA: DUF6788 family protein [Actinomycetes bacterium]
MLMATPRQRERVLRQRAALVEEISRIGWILPGSITDRFTRCGNPACRCRTQPPQLHGPYPTWTRKVDNRTITRTLTPEQAEHLRPWLDNNRRLRRLLTELEALSLQAVEDTEGWAQK